MQPTPLKDPVTEEDWRRAQFTDEFDTVPLLLDADQQIYRFAGGVCRVLRREVPPWTLTRTDVSNNPSHLGLSYNAPNTAFGVAVPDRPFDPYTTRNKWVIDLGFGNPYYEGASGKMIRDVLMLPEKSRTAIATLLPLANGFKPYGSSFGTDIAIISTELQGGVLCGENEFSWPNPLCEGLVLFNERDSATFIMSANLLPKLDAVIRSIRELHTRIDVQCPAK